jgi:hypothetical protein
VLALLVDDAAADDAGGVGIATEDQERGLLNAYDGHYGGATGHAVGTNPDDLDASEEADA